MALRAITLDDIPALIKILKNPSFNVNNVIDKKYKLTSLQYAAMKNKYPIIELLLMYGANINKSDL
jgi:ankyrin repeat protein